MRRIFILGLAALLISGAALADTKPILKNVPDSQKVGSGRLSFLIWDVYDAALYAPNKIYQSNQPFALKLSYLIDLKGKDIATRSVEEMQKQGFVDELQLRKWQEAMEEIFPDVKEGNTITGIRDEQGHALFYLDDKFIGSVNEKDFTNKFFAIWLDKKTSEPGLRIKLLGMN